MQHFNHTHLQYCNVDIIDLLIIEYVIIDDLMIIVIVSILK